jgi:hypothetical protein
MIRLCRASVMVAVALLASVATGYGTSAWVLWMHTIADVNGARFGEDWERSQAVSTESQCSDARDEALPIMLAYFRGKYDGTGTVVRREGTTVVISWRDSDGLHLTKMRHECWPDTVDPRGPKK